MMLRSLRCWRALAVVGALVAAVLPTSQANADFTGNGVTTAKGFDACVLPSTTTMATWWTYSPYWWYGAYLGGRNFTCSTPPNGGWITTVHNQGWNFAPIWVDYQAPCSGGPFAKMSYTQSTAQNQGIQAAIDASNAMVNN